MAPVPEAYFPSLDKCFTGDVQLLSWKRAFLYTCNPEGDVDDTGSLHAFLSHPESVQLLSNCLNGFTPPSAKSKSDLESKTAAIHAETTAQATYSITELKADALWLSREAGIDEISALRIAVLEWQNRPATRLLSGFAEEETTSLRSAAGVENFRVSLAGPSFAEIFSQNASREGNASGFVSEENRRLRLKNLYLSERTHIIKTARKLFALFLHSNTNGHAPKKSEQNRSDLLCQLGAAVFKDRLAGDESRSFVQASIQAVQTRLSALEGDGGWLGVAESSEVVEDLWRTALVEEILHIVQILFLQLQASAELPSADIFLSWLRLMSDYSFLEPLQAPCQNPIEVLLPLQAFVSLTTLAFMKLPLTIPSIINKTHTQESTAKPPYFLSKDEIGKLNEIFVAAVVNSKVASPAAFAWGLVLNTMRELALNDKETRELEQFHSAVDSFQSNTPHSTAGGASDLSLYEELLECARAPKYTADDSITLLTSDEVKIMTFEIIMDLATKVGSTSAVDNMLTNRWARTVLLDLIRVAVVYLDYSPEIVGSVLAILVGSSTGSLWPANSLSAPSSDPRWIFMKDDLLMDNIFRLARSRFPYETLPFLKICRALISTDLVNDEGVPEILDEMENMNTFTQAVPPDFQGYETVREDENANFVTLVESLPMIGLSPRRQFSEIQTGSALIVTGSSQVPSTTIGQVVSESKPAVIMWHHQYSSLSYLGSWLEEWNEKGGYSAGWGEDSIAEIIGLLADLLITAKEAQLHTSDDSGAKKILEMASDGLARQSDIVSVILDILERSLSNIGPRAGSEIILESTIACLRFITALLEVLPGRVWPFLSRSSLLGSDGKGGMMTAIISALEVPSGDYPFLLRCVRFFESVVDDAVTRAVLRRSPNSTMGKATAVSDWTAGVPSHMMRGIMLNFVRIMVEVYNSSINWRFNAQEQRFEINTALAKTFERILYYAYGTNDTTKLDARVTGVFSSSATYLLDVLRPQSTDDLPFNPILRLVVDGLQTPPTLYLRYLTLVEKQVNSTLALSTRLLQAAQLLQIPPSLLEEQLFKAAPVLVKLYALHDAYRLPTISLLNTLITGAALDSDKEPPSLVGHLGAESSCLFLDVLSQFDKPLSDRALHLEIWQLLSAFITKRQQWLAVYILTGSSPRQTLKKTDDQIAPVMRGTPFLKIALDTLSNIEQVDLQVALALLEFVSHAQENWPWATSELRKHSQFFSSLVNHVSKLNIGSLPVVDQIFTTRIAAVVADLCTIYLHSAKDMQDRTFYKTLIPLVSWYAKDAVEVSGYNASLHANLKKNFEMRYSGCKLADFKRTTLQPRTLGHAYCYDIRLGEKLLSYDFAWAGTRNQGFSQEFERANLNLSLIEAKVSLLHSWKFFAIEHCADFMTDREVQKSMAVVVQRCLEANTSGVPQETIFARIQQTRVDFAQALLQRLVEIGSRGAEVFGLLGVVWDAVRSRRATYEEALINDDIEYYRSLLNVLFLALQFHLDSPSRTVPETLSKKAEVSSDLGLVVEIAKTVVAQGFKSLTAYLHDRPEKCTPKDFAIITAILQSCLQVKNVDRVYEHIVYHIADNDTARHATSLFSWADQLAVAGDPVYGELSISFLVKLSTIPMLAEHLAVEGVLVRLSTCRLTNILRQSKGFGPFDPVPRMYAIWTGGILPLCLNLLYHVTRTAPEVAAFLNQFEGQLTRAAEAFAADRTAGPTARRVCLNMTSEAYSLALISFILDRFRQAGASAGMDAESIQELKWDKAQVKEDIQDLLERRQLLRARIVATSEKEAELSRQKPVNASLSGAENRLEEKIVSELKAALVCLGGEEA
ncbi:nucleoporin subcomplex protein binding to Pom34-domain-containing protein [Aspergillus coremiiformis]|uniref:Nucleoporin subcomplex protein binding to Pom34-domain-containing protein n=1 Tax=Aspergillus coremiiformis TaxID=138285 RepID=A0A5N6ZBL2_9EURO|nr:nucleoporin subcomplex protein binding to Pom34-domain-containing protein [Aspergillus coremiiformis]